MNQKTKIEDVVEAICAILSIKTNITLVIDTVRRTSISLNTNIMIINYNEFKDNAQLIRVIAHEWYHLYQKENDVNMQYSDRHKIENGYSYLELNYDLEVEAEAFSYLFINKLGANINEEDDLLQIEGMNELTDNEKNKYIYQNIKKYIEKLLINMNL